MRILESRISESDIWISIDEPKIELFFDTSDSEEIGVDWASFAKTVQRVFDTIKFETDLKEDVRFNQ